MAELKMLIDYVQFSGNAGSSDDVLPDILSFALG